MVLANCAVRPADLISCKEKPRPFFVLWQYLIVWAWTTGLNGFNGFGAVRTALNCLADRLLCLRPA